MIAKIKKVKDELGQYFFPLTSSKAVVMEDGTTRLDDKIVDIEAKANDWDNFRNNGGEIGGNIVAFNGTVDLKKSRAVFSNNIKADFARTENAKDLVIGNTYANTVIEANHQNNFDARFSGDANLYPIWTDKTNALSGHGNGYIKLSNGFILQWGMGETWSGGHIWNAYPISFPNVCLNVQLTLITTNTGAIVCSNSYNQSGINFVSNVNSTSVRWVAIGY